MTVIRMKRMMTTFDSQVLYNRFINKVKKPDNT